MCTTLRRLHTGRPQFTGTTISNGNDSIIFATDMAATNCCRAISIPLTFACGGVILALWCDFSVYCDSPIWPSGPPQSGLASLRANRDLFISSRKTPTQISTYTITRRQPFIRHQVHKGEFLSAYSILSFL